jgi:PAS domain S-box-containing protein
MTKRTTEPASQADLRLRAVSRVTGGGQGAHQSASAAFGVLHELASSPSTAADALALLHELQVHQVELDLQAEELRSSRVELEAALQRQTQLYESAPVGCFTVDLGGTLHELNSTGAALLGSQRDALLDQSLYGFLAPPSARALRAVLRRVSDGHRGEVCALQLIRREGGSRTVYATANADPAGRTFLVAFMDAGADDQARSNEPPG